MSVSPDHLSHTETKMTRTDQFPVRLVPTPRRVDPVLRDCDTLIAGLAALLPLGAIEALIDRLERRP